MLIAYVRISRHLGLLAVLALVVAACNGASSTDTTEQTGRSTTTSAPDPTDSSAPVSAPSSDFTFTVADAWTAAAIGQGTKPVIALDADGTPGVAWISERIGDGFIAFASAAGNWEVETVAEGYFYGPIGVAFSPEGEPNIAYHDHQANEFDPQLGDLVLGVRDDGQWLIDVAEDEGHDGWDSTVVIGDDGVVHAAGVDPAQFNRTEGVEYYRNSGDDWEVTPIGSGPIPYQYNVGLALDPSGSPSITYYNDADQDLMFASLQDGSWTLERAVEEGNVGKYSSLAFTSEGRPAVSFFNQFSSTEGEILYAVKDDEGWAVETVGEITAFSEQNARRTSSLAFDSQGRAHLAFSDTSGVWYSVRGDNGWETEQIVTGDLPLGQLVSLVIDQSDRPHITMYEVIDPQTSDGAIAYLTTN